MEVFARFSFIMPASASVMSMSALSMVRTRSDSSTQSARASRAAGSGVVLHGDLGGAAQTGQRGAEVVGDVVERFAHAADKRLVLVEHAVELAGQFLQFVWRALAGTRADRLPVSMMARAVATTSRTGLVARWAKRAPPSTPSNNVGVITIRKSRRNGRRSISRLLVPRPTWRTARRASASRRW